MLASCWDTCQISYIGTIRKYVGIEILSPNTSLPPPHSRRLHYCPSQPPAAAVFDFDKDVNNNDNLPSHHPQSGEPTMETAATPIASTAKSAMTTTMTTDNWDDDNCSGDPREKGRGFNGGEVPQIQRQWWQLRCVCAVLKPQGMGNPVPPGIPARALRRRGRHVGIPVLERRIRVQHWRGRCGGGGGGSMTMMAMMGRGMMAGIQGVFVDNCSRHCRTAASAALGGEG